MASAEHLTEPLARLVDIAVQSDDPEQVVVAAQRELGQPVGLAGPDGEPLGHAPSDAAGRRALAIATAAGRSGLVAPPGWRIVRVTRATHLLGLLAVGKPEHTTVVGEALTSVLTGLLAEQLHRVMLVRAQLELFLDRLVTPPSMPPSLARRDAARLGVTLADAYWPAVICWGRRPPRPDALQAIAVDAQSVADGGFGIVRADCVVLLHAADVADAATRARGWFRRVVELARAVAPSAGVQAVAADRAAPLGALSTGVEELKHALALGPRADGNDPLVPLRRFALDRMLVAIEPVRAGAFVEEQLGPLIAEDERHHAGLLAVLEAELDFSRHDLAAARCFMHRNTFRHRLRQAEELLGRSLEDPDERLALHVALRLRRMAERDTAAGRAAPVAPPAPRHDAVRRRPAAARRP